MSQACLHEVICGVRNAISIKENAFVTSSKILLLPERVPLYFYKSRTLFLPLTSNAFGTWRIGDWAHKVFPKVLVEPIGSTKDHNIKNNRHTYSLKGGQKGELKT